MKYWFPILFMFLVSCANKPQVEPGLDIQATSIEIMPNQFLVEIKPTTSINILVRDLVTVNTIETGLKVAKLVSKEPLLYLVQFNQKLIDKETMRHGLTNHPNVLGVLNK